MLFRSQPQLYSTSFIVESAENDLIEIMEALPKELHFSSLPRFIGEKRIVEIYLAHHEQSIVEQWSQYFKDAVRSKGKMIKDC